MQYGPGNDWCYFGVFANSNTGLMPTQVYGGSFFTLAPTIPSPFGQTLRVTGYGTANGFSLPFEQNYTGKTATGPYTQAGATLRYQVDTETEIPDPPSKLKALASSWASTTSPVARTPAATSIWAIRLRASTTPACSLPSAAPWASAVPAEGPSAATSTPWATRPTISAPAASPPSVSLELPRSAHAGRGLSWDWNASRFLACDGDLNLFSLTVAGQLTSIGPISGTAGAVISGLGYDPRARVLWGVAASTGQLYAIDPITAVATPVGVPQGGMVTGLEYDTIRNRPLGYRQHDPEQARADRYRHWHPHRHRQPRTTAIAQCHGLGFNAADGNLYTINASTSIMYRVNPATGVATSVGATLGLFGSSFGMAIANPRPPCPQDFNNDGSIDPDDLGDFINCYFSIPPCPGATSTATAASTPDDLGDFINTYFGPPC